MEIKVAARSIDQISRQRNLFLGLTLVLGTSLLLISIRLVSFDQKIILVPGLEREFSLSGKGVSSSYLEETALLFLSHLLDISKDNISHKQELILKYTSSSHGEYIKAIKEYFANAGEQYRKFDLATYFTVKNLQVDEKKLTVIATGVLSSSYGKKGHEARDVSYLASFEYAGGYLRLKEFGQIKEELKDQSKNQKEMLNVEGLK